MFVPFNPTDLFGRKNSARNLNLDLEVSGSDTEIQSAKVTPFKKLFDIDEKTNEESPL